MQNATQNPAIYKQWKPHSWRDSASVLTTLGPFRQTLSAGEAVNFGVPEENLADH